MSGTIYKAASGALLQQMRLDMFSNNLANVNTAGYKADIPPFSLDILQQQELEDVGEDSKVPPMKSRSDFSSGPMVRTNSPLDVAIVGKGFFEVTAPQGTRYTRKGTFTVNDQGELSTLEGWPVQGQGGTIKITGSDIQISDKGEVIVDGDIVSSLNVVDFDDLNQLQKDGNSLFVPKEGARPTPLEPASIQLSQGFIEQSNVNAIRTMTEIIETMRAFETYQRIIRTSDDTTAKLINEVGRSA